MLTQPRGKTKFPYSGISFWSFYVMKSYSTWNGRTRPNNKNHQQSLKLSCKDPMVKNNDITHFPIPDKNQTNTEP